MIRIRTDRPSLSVVEKSGDPNAIAAEFVRVNTETETSRIGRPRGSSLYDACMRMHVIGSKEGMDKTQWSGTRDRLVFGIGNALHFWVQNTNDVLGDRRIGWWKCVACGVTSYFGGPPKKKCLNCGARPLAMLYREHSIDMRKPWAVTGHPDMFVLKTLKERKILRVLEMKTMDGDTFDGLAAPLAPHLWQIQTYMWACAMDKAIPMEVDPAVGYIMYISKKSREKTLPFKVYPVLRDSMLLTRIQAKLTSYSEGMRTYPNSLPPVLSDCERLQFASSRAKYCPTLELCKRLQAQSRRKL